MRGIGVAVSAAVATGCGFDLTLPSAAVDASLPGDPDGAPPSDAPIDSAPIPRLLYAASDTLLYRLDVDAMTATMVGPIAMGATDYDVDGLAFDGTNLLGLTPGGTELLTIDPSTAAVTARRPITPTTATYGGLTVAPAGEAGPTAVVFAGSGSQLVTIDPATGVATAAGTFGGGRTFFSDLAWVKGVGLFVTLAGGSCEDYCFARVNVTTGAATPFRSNLTSKIYGLSGYRDILWAFNANGPVQRVNMTDGILDIAFDPEISWTEAAQ